MRLYAFTIMACALLLSACQQDAISGIYQTTHESGIHIGKPLPENAHEFPNIDLERCSDTHCVETYEASNTLGVLPLNDRDLAFGASLSFFNGHSCSLQGVAVKDADGWVYDNQADDCVLDITLSTDGITLDADDTFDCRRNCGARGYFKEIYFPLSSKIVHDVKQQDIECIGVYSDACKKAE